MILRHPKAGAIVAALLASLGIVVAGAVYVIWHKAERTTMAGSGSVGMP